MSTTRSTSLHGTAKDCGTSTQQQATTTRISSRTGRKAHRDANHRRIPHPSRQALTPVCRHFWKPVINLDKLWTLVPAEKREEYIAGKKDTVPVIDLLPFGYSKVLGKGRLPEVPIVVKARWVSKLVRCPPPASCVRESCESNPIPQAEKKITEAGGVVELVA